MATINSTIGTSTTAWAFGNGWYQRYSFYALGRFWVFYSDGTNFVWRTSTDGSSWSAAQTVRAWTRGYLGSIAFDGTNVHYVYRSGAPSSFIYYRMGSIDSSGDITWLAVEQTVHSMDANHRANDPSIAIDSNGYPWVAYDYSTVATLETVAYLAKSSTKNGTWTNETVLFTSPYQFSASTFDAPAQPTLWCAVAPMSSGQMYALACPVWNPIVGTEDKIKGRLWNGSAWGDEETVATPIADINDTSISPVVDSHDNIYLAYLDRNPDPAWADIYVTIRNASTGLWDTPTLVKAHDPTGSYGPLTRDTNDIIYLFYQSMPTAKHIYYRRYINGAWEAITDWITETAAFADATGTYHSAAVAGALGRIIYTYVTLTVSPFDVKMAALEILNTRGWAM